MLRLGDSRQLQQEPGLRVDPDKIDVPAGKGGLHFVSLVLAHEAVIHEHAGELFAHRLRQKRRRHGGVHAAGQGQEHLAAAHLFPDLPDGGPAVVAHGPVPRRAADLIEEVPDHLYTVFRVVDLRVELDAVEAPALVADGRRGAGIRVGGERESLRHLRHVVPMAHPGDPLRRKTPEQPAVCVKERLCPAILPGGVRLGRRDLAPQGVGHELAAVADPQHRHPQRKNRRVAQGRVRLVDAAGTSGENEPDGVHAFELLQRRGIGLDLAVHAALPDPPGDELVVLSAEVQHDDSLVFHRAPLLSWEG